MKIKASGVGILKKCRLYQNYFRQDFISLQTLQENKMNLTIVIKRKLKLAREVLAKIIVSIQCIPQLLSWHSTMPERPLKILTSGTYREPSRDSQGTNTKIYGQHLYSCLLQEKKYSDVLNGDFRKTSTGSSFGMSQGPNNVTFEGRPLQVSHTCFLN